MLNVHALWQSSPTFGNLSYRYSLGRTLPSICICLHCSRLSWPLPYLALCLRLSGPSSPISRSRQDSLYHSWMFRYNGPSKEKLQEFIWNSAQVPPLGRICRPLISFLLVSLEVFPSLQVTNNTKLVVSLSFYKGQKKGQKKEVPPRPIMPPHKPPLRQVKGASGLAP